MSASLKKLLTADVVAELLGLTTQALYEAVRKNLIPHIRIGRRLRFDPDAIASWTANGGTPLGEGQRQ